LWVHFPLYPSPNLHWSDRLIIRVVDYFTNNPEAHYFTKFFVWDGYSSSFSYLGMRSDDVLDLHWEEILQVKEELEKGPSIM
jgi:hypothetical protein